MKKELCIDREEALAAKKALQEAQELIDRVCSKQMPGAVATALSKAHVLVSKGITALRDADRTDGLGVQTVKKAPRPIDRIEEREVVCTHCGRSHMSRSQTSVKCRGCKKAFFVSKDAQLAKRKKMRELQRCN